MKEFRNNEMVNVMSYHYTIVTIDYLNIDHIMSIF